MRLLHLILNNLNNSQKKANNSKCVKLKLKLKYSQYLMFFCLIFFLVLRKKTTLTKNTLYSCTTGPINIVKSL